MRRKALLATAGVLAALLMLASAASGCTVFRGTFTIKGNLSSARVTSTGTGTGMTQTLNSSVARASAVGGFIKIWTGKDAYGRKLPAGPYAVRYYNSHSVANEGPGYTDHYHWWTDCMWGGPGVTLTGNNDVKVGTDGKIAGQPVRFNLPASTPDTAPEESTVCISDRGGAFGNQVPLTIV